MYRIKEKMAVYYSKLNSYVYLIVGLYYALIGLLYHLEARIPTSQVESRLEDSVLLLQTHLIKIFLNEKLHEFHNKLTGISSKRKTLAATKNRSVRKL